MRSSPHDPFASAPRTVSGYRQYPPAMVRSVRAIKRAQSLGFTLEEIQELTRIRTRGGSAATCAAAICSKGSESSTQQRRSDMSEQKSMPVCCTLPEAELRVAEIEGTIAKKIAEVRELDDGYALRFPAEAGIVEEIGRFIAFERVCCAFLDFSLRVTAGDGPIWLELTGSGAAKNFLRPTIAPQALLDPGPKVVISRA